MSAVVEMSTHNPKIQVFNHASGAGKMKMTKSLSNILSYLTIMVSH